MVTAADLFKLTQRLDRIVVAVERIVAALEPTTKYTTTAELAEQGRCPQRGGVDSWQCIRPVGHLRQHVAENGHTW